MNKIDTLLLERHTNKMFEYGAFTKIAKELKVSRERVRQRAKRLGMVPIKSRENILVKWLVCKGCGVRYKQRDRDSVYCGELCKQFYMTKRPEAFICEWCLQPFYPKGYRKPRFCSKSHFGKWISHNVAGFKFTPENRRYYNK